MRGKYKCQPLLLLQPVDCERTMSSLRASLEGKEPVNNEEWENKCRASRMILDYVSGAGNLAGRSGSSL